jgi:hypothetical protein
MQGTVSTFDPGTRSGTLLLDDGTQLVSGLRQLRLGQRLSIETGPGDEVQRVGIPGIR